MQLPEKHVKHDFENLLPLVNVVFLLLIFFMVAGAFSTPDPFTIQPTIAKNDSNADTKVLTIIMSDQGELAVDNQIMSIEKVITLIQEHIHTQSLEKVQLKPDANADALHVVELFEQLSRTELRAIHVLTSAP